MENKGRTAYQLSKDINKSEKELQSTGGNQVKPALGNTDSGDHQDVLADQEKKKGNNHDTMGGRKSDKEYPSDREFPEKGTPGSRSGSQSNEQ